MTFVRSRPLRLLLAIGVAVAAASGAAIGLAIVLAIVELYLTGHNMGSITVPLIEWPNAGGHLSLADAVLLGVSGLAGAGTAWLIWKVTQQPAGKGHGF